MKKCIVVVTLLALACLLTACGNGESVPSETAAPTETTVVTEPPETTLPPTEPPTTVPETTAPPATEPTLPEGAEALSQEELDALTELFTQPHAKTVKDDPAYTNWFNMAMTSHYETPQQLDLNNFFRQGIGGPENFNYEPSDEEKAYLDNNTRVPTHLSVKRIPKQTMNEVLLQYFGLTLDEMDGNGLELLAYYSVTDCYYTAIGGMCYARFEILDGYRTAEGNVVVNYNLYTNIDCTITLKPVDGGYQILSNIYNNYEEFYGTE